MTTKKKPPSAGRIAKLAQNPGTRAALADKYLSPTQLRQRQMNQRLDAPVVAGSALTNRQLSHDADSAATLNFGGNPVAQATQLGRDQQGWYAQYQAAANQLKTDIQNNNTQATNAAQGIVGAVGQLGSATAVGDGQVKDDALKASVIRQALSGSFGQMLAAKGQSANNYAATTADLVVPGERLTAANQSAGKVTDARAQLAAFLNKYKSDATTGEERTVNDAAKTALASQALMGTTANQQAQQTQASQSLAETTRSHRANERQAATTAKQRAQAEAAKVNAYGYTNAQWSSMTTDQRRKIINQGKGGKDSTYLSQDGQNTFRRSFDAAKTTAAKLKGHYDRNQLRGLLKGGRQASTVFLDANNQVIPNAATLADARKRDKNAHPFKIPAVRAITDEAVLSAVLDTVMDGHLSQATIRKLHKAGIKVNGLGVPTKPTTASTGQQALNAAGQAIGTLPGATG